MNSKMPQVYLHYYGNESSEGLLQAYGIITKDQQKLDPLKPKQCPNCNEVNKPDQTFCVRCRMALSYAAYTEALERQQEKDNEMEKFRKELEELKAFLRESP
jgi:hypothetical protein